MPAWMTPLLCVVWCARSRSSRSSTRTFIPRRASARATARPTMPPPATAMSCIEQVERGADHRLGVDLVVLVQLGQVARLAEPLDAEAGHGNAVDGGQEAQRVGMAVEHADDRQRLGEKLAEDPLVAVAETGAGLEGAEQQVGAG